MTKLPAYDELPIDPKYPKNSAWGVFGKDDNLGTLNLLTPENTAKAAQENVQRGAVFSLNWDLELPAPAPVGRSAVEHRVRDRFGTAGIGKVHNNWFDDVYDSFNTQSSTQWDGLLHVAHIKSGCFYNGVSPADLAATDESGASSDRLGIHHMARRGIAGRAVLLDYARWCERQGKQIDPFTRHAISVGELDQVAKDQGVVFREGDILLLRTGWMAAYTNKQQVDLNDLQCIGVEASEDMYRWLWNNRFAAVAGDHVAFEAYPTEDWNDSLHTRLLGGFGMPIGEMFDLEKLAEDCARDGRYTCFITSAPLNKLQGIATPSNALCIK